MSFLFPPGTAALSAVRRPPFSSSSSSSSSSSCRCSLAGLVTAVVVLSSSPLPSTSSVFFSTQQAAAEEMTMTDDETFADVPQTLSGGEGGERKRIQKPKSRQAESCTVKCLGTCIRGGAGSPGEGPFNIRRPIVVFKQGFRSRNYCLVECSDICNLIKDGEDGP